MNSRDLPPRPCNSVFCFVREDQEKYSKMREIYKLCLELNVPIPSQVGVFFGWRDINSVPTEAPLVTKLIGFLGVHIYGSPHAKINLSHIPEGVEEIYIRLDPNP